MIEKRSLLRADGRAVAVSGVGASGHRVIHGIGPGSPEGPLALGRDTLAPSLHHVRLNKHILLRRGEVDDDILFDDQALLEGAVESTAGGISAAEGVTAGAATGTGSTIAGGAVGAGTVAVVSGAALGTASDGSRPIMPSPTPGFSGANSAPTKMGLSANAIHHGVTVPLPEEGNPGGLKIGDLSMVGADTIGDFGRLSLRICGDAVFFEIREVLGADGVTVVGHDLFYIGPTPNFDQQQYYTIAVEFTNRAPGPSVTLEKTFTIVVTVDGPQASQADDGLLGTSGNDFLGGMASGDIFIGGAGTDVVQLDGAVLPAGGPIRLGFYPGDALQPVLNEATLAEAAPSLDGVLAWGNELFIQAEQIRFMLPGESLWRVFSIESLKTNPLTLPDGFILPQNNPTDPIDLGTHRLLLSSEDDWVMFGDCNGVLDAGAGDDCVATAAAYSVVSGGRGDDWLAAGDLSADAALAINLNTFLLGDFGNDRLVALSGRVDVWGGEGLDFFMLAGAKATLIVHDYDPGLDSILWADVDGLGVYTSTDSDGSITFFYASAGQSLSPSTTHVQGTEVSTALWPEAAVDAIGRFGLSSLTWMTEPWTTV